MELALPNTMLTSIPDRGQKPVACPHCRRESTSGTHNGCHECGRVKHTNGRRQRKEGED